MKIDTANRFIRRYTNTAYLIDMLSNSHLPLLNTSSWDDFNDQHYIEEYKTLNNASSVLCACFTSANETYHHWRIFAPGPNGVCVTFHKEKLIEDIKKTSGTIWGDVSYHKIEDVKNLTSSENLPFLKRNPYSDESEFRIIYRSKDVIGYKNVSISLNSIKEISLSPWLNVPTSNTMKSVIKSLIGSSSSITTKRSTLIRNERWINAARRAAVNS